MSPRTLTLIPIVVVATFLGIVGLVLFTGGDDGRRSGSAAALDPLAAAVTVVPSDAPFVALAETDAAAGPLPKLTAVTDRIPGATIAYGRAGDALGGIDLQNDLLPVLGHPIVFAVAELPDRTSDAAPDPLAGLLGAFPFRVPELGALLAASRFGTVAGDPAGLRALLDRLVDSGGLQRDGEARGFAVFRRPDGGAYGFDGGLFVGAGSQEDLRAALTLAAQGRSGQDADGLRSGSLTKSSLLARFRGFPGRSRSALRATLDVGAVERSDSGDLQVPWVSALQRVSFAIVPEEAAVSVPFRFSTDADAVTAGDVPIAGGAASPSPAAEDDTEVVVGLRDAAHTIEFVRRTLRVTNADLASDLDGIETSLRRYARVDPTTQILAKLTGTTTITTDLKGTLTLRSELADPEPVADALSQLQRLSTLSSFVGGIGVDVDTRGITVEDDGDGRYRVERDGDTVARAAVIDGVLVASNRESTDLQALADAFPETPENAKGGALSVRMSAEALVTELAGMLGLPEAATAALEPLGQISVNARGSTSGVSGSLRLTVGSD